MITSGTAAVIAAVLGAANLLTNPGFEQTRGEAPVGWDRFVAPQPGAVGRLDGEAFEGNWAALLHTPLPYAKEPVNNWSQNLYGDFAGKALHARARIRTADAGQAALWVQCWKRGERFPHALFTTDQASPLRGTHDWTEVVLDFTPPPATDFLTLRCVLLGTGSAWFDAVYLGEADAPTKPSDAAKPDAEKPSRPTAASAPAPSPSADAEAEIARLRAELEELKRAHYTLAGAVEEVRRQLRDLRAAPPAPAAPAPPPAPAPRPTTTPVDENK